MLIRPGALKEDIGIDNIPCSAGSDTASWSLEPKSPKSADTFETEKRFVSRIDTFDSLSKGEMRRTDTTTTLVEGQMNVDADVISPHSKTIDRIEV